jgi:hypothetical protein
MDKEGSRFGILRRLLLAVVPLLAIAISGVTLFSTSAVEAANPSLGVGCSASSSGGVTNVTLRFKVDPKGNADVVLDLTDVDGSTYPINAKTTISVPNVADGEYDVVVTVGGSVVRTALATVDTTDGVQCRVQTPNPNI